LHSGERIALSLESLECKLKCNSLGILSGNEGRVSFFPFAMQTAIVHHPRDRCTSTSPGMLFDPDAPTGGDTIMRVFRDHESLAPAIAGLEGESHGGSGRDELEGGFRHGLNIP